MGRHRTEIPQPSAIRRHRSGRARVWYRPPGCTGDWHYLGPWDDQAEKPSAAAMAAYWRLVEQIRRDAGGPGLKRFDWLVGEMLAEYRDAMKAKMSAKELHRVKICGVRILDRHPEATVREFGPAQLSDWQDWLGRECGLTRSTIQKERRVLFRAFRWAFKLDRIRSAETRWADLIECDGPEEFQPARIVRPAPLKDVQAALRFLRPTISAMVRLQLATGMRPGEMYVMRPQDIHRAGKVTLPSGAMVDVGAVNKARSKLWFYVVPSHKTEHHGHDRYVWFAKDSQVIITPFLDRPADQFLFVPHESMAEFRSEQREERASKVQPSQVSRARLEPRKRAGKGFRDSAYRQAIIRACNQAGVPPFSPYSLRHAALTRIRDESGVIDAALVAGHRGTEVTQRYTRTASEAMRAAEVVRKSK